jgi:transcriptional regulator with XRE-family HTH domain
MLLPSNALAMNESFGARLRAQRKDRQIALSTIADQTKIRLPLLEELEHDNVSHWPRGIFRRSYLRAYADAIGLNPDDTLREFLDLYPDPQEEPVAVLNGLAQSAPDNGGKRPSTRLHYMLGTAIGALPHLFRGDGRDTGPEPGARSAAVLTTTHAPEPHRANDFRQDVVDSSPRTPEAPQVPATAGERPESPAVSIDLGCVAEICTRLGRAQSAADVAPALADAAQSIGAVGVILWMWDPAYDLLRLSLSHGYSRELLGLLPHVRSDADNAIAVAFRTARRCIVPSSDVETGAIAVPLVSPVGCGGVLALEVPPGYERHEQIMAVATILAAQLASLVEPAAVPLLRTATA